MILTITIRSVQPRLYFLADRIESQIARDVTNRYEENENGRVDRSEFPGGNRVFERIDQDQNEHLSLSELKRYVDLLGQHERSEQSHPEEQASRDGKGLSFSVSSHAELATSLRRYFAGETRQLDTDGNDLLDREEIGMSAAEFQTLDEDRDDLISPREWSEGFVKNNTQIETVIKAYRFGHGLFRNNSGIIQMSV
jgi:Ca2+-binding EF-hand superfamily protein